jgi:DNA-binding response OmpR family regulator
MRALIVKNNNAYRELLEHTFAQQGFDTDTDDSIESARAYTDSEPYDILSTSTISRL